MAVSSFMDKRVSSVLLIMLAVGACYSYWSLVHVPNNSNNNNNNSWRTEFESEHLSDVLFYNRLRKTGSETTSRTFEKLAKKLHYKLDWDWKAQNLPPAKYRFLNDTQYSSFTKRVLNDKRPVLFIKHMYFIDFNRFHSNSQPLYMNIIRDPIDRKISEYNYMRYRPDRPKHFKKEQHDMTMDQCITTNNAECTSVEESLILAPFFCGHDPVCRSNSSFALKLAKRNIERHFVVVGVMERMRDTFAALECTMPQFFAGLLKEYDILASNKKEKMNKTKHKTVPSPAVHAQYKQFLSMEYALHDWIVQRFDNQVNRLKGICKHLKWDS